MNWKIKLDTIMPACKMAGIHIESGVVKMAIIKEYTIKCTQANGSEYTYKMRGFTRMEAAAIMREDKKVFTGCYNWKLVPKGTTAIRIN